MQGLPQPEEGPGIGALPPLGPQRGTEPPPRFQQSPWLPQLCTGCAGRDCWLSHAEHSLGLHPWLLTCKGNPGPAVGACCPDQIGVDNAPPYPADLPACLSL